MSFCRTRCEDGLERDRWFFSCCALRNVLLLLRWAANVCASYAAIGSQVDNEHNAERRPGFHLAPLLRHGPEQAGALAAAATAAPDSAATALPGDQARPAPHRAGGALPARAHSRGRPAAAAAAAAALGAAARAGAAAADSHRHHRSGRRLGASGAARGLPLAVARWAGLRGGRPAGKQRHPEPPPAADENAVTDRPPLSAPSRLGLLDWADSFKPPRYLWRTVAALVLGGEAMVRILTGGCGPLRSAELCMLCAARSS